MCDVGFMLFSHPSGLIPPAALIPPSFPAADQDEIWNMKICDLFCADAALSISLSSDRQRALLVDFSCAVHHSTVVSEDLIDVVRDVLPPHLISPEVS